MCSGLNAIKTINLTSGRTEYLRRSPDQRENLHDRVRRGWVECGLLEEGGLLQQHARLDQDHNLYDFIRPIIQNKTQLVNFFYAYY